MDIRPISSTSQAATPVAERIAPVPAQPASVAKSGAEPASGATPQTKQPPDEEQVTQALKSINELLRTRSPDLEFSIDSDSDRAIVKVVDKETQEVIRQMPSEDALQIAKALDRLQSMLIRETA
jgi:flagellar protein FlaG